MGLHTGTHIDFPYHFLPHGSKLDDYPLQRFMGKVRVCEIESTTAITLSELKSKNIAGTHKVLFKTKNSFLWQNRKFCPNFIGLEENAARYLVDCNIDLVGIDYLSIQAYSDPDNTVHTVLLANDVLILEGLDLSKVQDGEYLLFCCPLYIPGVEAAPVRALLMPLTELIDVIID